MDEDRLLYSDHMTRLWRLLDAEVELEVPAQGLYSLLSDCYPTGKRSDILRATGKQVRYICHLAGLDDYGPPHDSATPAYHFAALSLELGMSGTMAGHIIGKLRKERQSVAA